MQQGFSNILEKFEIVATTMLPKTFYHIKGRAEATLWYVAYTKEIQNLETPVILRLSRPHLMSKWLTYTGSWKVKAHIVAHGDLQKTVRDFFTAVASTLACRLHVS